MKKRRKTPTKAELEQLQKLYKTDEKIGERLGGVPAYLVAYWRRKKGIPKYSLPKFSEREICNLWERFGDDEKAGLELGISKAAFYNWRRRYGFREKPAFLKLEQLELNFPGSRLNVHASSLYGKRTVVQKILARVAGAEKVTVGDIIDAEPDVAVLRGTTGEVLEVFKSRGVEYVWNPGRVVIALGLNSHSSERDPASDHLMVREFVRRQGMKNLYDLREGICASMIVEKGHILPGHLVLSAGGQETSFGCVGAFGTGIDEPAMAALWATGKAAVQVPATTQVVISGRRYRGTYAMDIALSAIDKLGAGATQDKVIEYSGSVISQMTLSERFTICSMSTEMGVTSALCPYDSTTRRYLTGRTSGRSTPVIPDKDAEYSDAYQISIDQLVPQLAGPGSVKTIRPVAEREGITINQVVLGSCASGRFDELRVAAEMLKGKQIHPSCRMLVVPGSRSVYLEALKKGLIRVFVEAGALVMNPGSCPCQGTTFGKLAAGERCLITTNTHPIEHLGPSNADVYICSPATAAVSALNASITDPTRFVK